MSISDRDALIKIEEMRLAYNRILDFELVEYERITQNYESQLSDMQQNFILLPVSPPSLITIPAIFNRSYDENFISDYLAYILNPRINGVGTEPLETLLRITRIMDYDVDFYNVEIEREFNTGSGRIDFLITIEDKLIIGIENKIHSQEGHRQTHKYSKSIRKQFNDKNCYFIYLTPTGAKASSKDFYSISYKQVLEAFKTINYDWKADIHKSTIWEDFLSHLETYIVMEKNTFDFSPRAKLYIDNYSMIKDIEKSFEDDWSKLLDFIKSKLDAHINDSGWETVFNKGRNYWHQAYKNNWVQPDLFLHYEYFLSRDRLISGKLDFMFEVEGKNSDQFVDLFDNEFPRIKEQYDILSIEYRPNDRKHAIARKIYKSDSPYIAWDELFISAFDEFSFLTDIIDNVFSKYETNIKELEE